jgi:hypothetical protein
MALGVVLAPQMEQPDPQSTGARVERPPKPTNFLELGQEPLSSGPNEGLCLRFNALPMPRSMATEDWP